MAFTYTDTLLTDRDVIRFTINDTVSSSGPRPGSGTATNFTDNEIAGILTVEGTANRAIARCYEILAASWARYGLSEIGPRKEDLKAVSKSYADLAKQWRSDYGYSTSTITNGFVTRVDANSNDIDSGEVDENFFIDRWWE